MAPGSKDENPGKDDLAGLEEATAGWDPYVSDLLQGRPAAPREERRRATRDRTPARRRAILASGMDESDEQSG